MANQKHTSIDPEDIVYNENPERMVHQPGFGGNRSAGWAERRG